MEIKQINSIIEKIDKRKFNGGFRKKCGRKPREVGIVKFRTQLKDYLTEEDVQKMIKLATGLAEKGDVVMLKFLLEQVFGRAPQPMKIGGDENNPEPIQIYLPQKNENMETTEQKSRIIP